MKRNKTHENPHHENPPNPTAIIMNVIVIAGSFKNGLDIRNTVCAKNPPQLKYFRTCPVVKYPLTWHKSAK